MQTDINTALLAPTPLGAYLHEEEKLKERLKLKQLTYAKVDVLYEIDRQGKKKTVYEIWRGVRSKARPAYKDVVDNAMVFSISRERFELFLKTEKRIKELLRGGPHPPQYGAEIQEKEKLTEGLLESAWQVNEGHSEEFIEKFYGKKYLPGQSEPPIEADSNNPGILFEDYVTSIIKDIERIAYCRQKSIEQMKQIDDNSGLKRKKTGWERYKKLTSAILSVAENGGIYRIPGRIYLETQIRLAVGCKHYIRGAGIICPDCGCYSPCRICHSEEFEHELKRPNIKLMRCYFCGQDGPIGISCSSCGQKVARVHCKKCNLLDGMHHLGKPSTHCPTCEYCLIAYPWDLIHCKVCGICHGKSLKCIPPIKGQMLCPVCCEPLASSFTQDGVHSLPCGHRLHGSCTGTMFKNGLYKCPLCKKLYLSDEARKLWEGAMHKAIKGTPPVTGVYVGVTCTECGHHFTEAENYSGHICPKCDTANTHVD